MTDYIYYTEDSTKFIQNIYISKIPLFDSANHRYSISLGQNTYNFVFKWNNLNEFWSLEIYDITKALLVTVKIVPDIDLIANYYYKITLPNSRLLCINLIDKYAYPDQFTLSTDIVIGIEDIIYE